MDAKNRASKRKYFLFLIWQRTFKSLLSFHHSWTIAPFLEKFLPWSKFSFPIFIILGLVYFFPSRNAFHPTNSWSFGAYELLTTQKGLQKSNKKIMVSKRKRHPGEQLFGKKAYERRAPYEIASHWDQNTTNNAKSEQDNARVAAPIFRV
jgi:hypothetical protein